MQSLDIVCSPLLSAEKWLFHGFSTRTGGSSTVYCKNPSGGGELNLGELNLGFTPSDPVETVQANRRSFARAITGDPDFPFVTLKQVHSAAIVCAGRSGTADTAHLSGDGMVTNEPGMLLAIQTADCIPILIADGANRAVGAFHAGWRGTVKGIVQAGLETMREEFGTDPARAVAAIGPGIGQCCFQVGEEVLDEFRSRFAYVGLLVAGERHLDLIEANRRQLLDSGVPARSISVAAECTMSRTDRYFSYRGEAGFTGRMFSVIGIRP